MQLERLLHVCTCMLSNKTQEIWLTHKNHKGGQWIGEQPAEKRWTLQAS